MAVVTIGGLYHDIRCEALKFIKMKKKLFILTEQEIWKDYPFEGCEDVGFAICFDAATLTAYIEIRPSLS